MAWNYEKSMYNHLMDVMARPANVYNGKRKPAGKPVGRKDVTAQRWTKMQINVKKTLTLKI